MPFTYVHTSLSVFYDAQSNKGLVQGHQNKLTVCHGYAKALYILLGNKG